MPERMYGPVLLMTGFFAAVVLLMVSLTPVIFAGLDTGESTSASRIHEVFAEQLLWEQWEPGQYTVTDSSQDDSYSFKSDPIVTFNSAGGDEHPIHCQLIRNTSSLYDLDTDDFWLFYQWYGWLGMKLAYTTVSLDEMVDSIDSTGNMSQVQRDARYSFKVVFWADNISDTETLEERFQNNLYNISLGISYNDTLDSISPWTMLSKILTFRMPGTNWFTNALIAVPIYTALLYIAFATIRSVIPLLGG